jgi:hypothetical protein
VENIHHLLLSNGHRTTSLDSSNHSIGIGRMRKRGFQSVAKGFDVVASAQAYLPQAGWPRATACPISAVTARAHSGTPGSSFHSWGTSRIKTALSKQTEPGGKQQWFS